MFKQTITTAAAAAVLGLSAVAAQAQDEITVAYFLEWPMPFQYGQGQAGAYDEAMGVKVNWVSFDTGTAMSAAMASGDVQIAVSQGVPPFVVATSAGQDLQIVDVAVSYADNDNCVVASKRWRSTSQQRQGAGRQEGRCAHRHRRALRLPETDGPFRRRYRRPWKSSTWRRPMALRRSPRAASTWSAAGAARCAG